MVEVKALVGQLLSRPAPKEPFEKRAASGYFEKYDTTATVKWGVSCNSCPLTDYSRKGQCLSGFTYDTVQFESLRCNRLISIDNRPVSKDNLNMIITCRGNLR
ncbi:hypothetical protein [Methanocella sp. MCL-LM]|uniref:hypothetical protein n=1 Tax=Methanocella sp. MCL-LM TaxID=3412035 RepID=UPI003C73E53E